MAIIEVVGRIYGFVLDKNTGEPIKNAGVEIPSLAIKTATGTDGAFEIANLKEGKYIIQVKKSGYKDYKSGDIEIKVANNKEPRVQHDVILEPLPPALTILDDKQQKIDIIDFGSDYNVVMRTFNIFNDSEDKLTWQITKKCDWIDKITPENGSLKANGTQSVVITIDRNKLQIGDNQTIVHITSDNGSKEIIVKASSTNVVETAQVAQDNIGSHSVVLTGRVIRDLYPSIMEYGFVYSLSQTPTLVNGAMSVSNSGKPQIGVYNMKVEGLEKENTYYVRAYVKNEKETKYGNQIQFKTISHVPQISWENDYYHSVKVTPTTISNIRFTVDGNGLPIEVVYFCWDTNNIPTIESSNKKKIEEKDLKPNAIVEITGLEADTKYYFRVYAKNAEEETYSEIKWCNTEDGKPTVKTISINGRGLDYLVVSGKTVSPDNIPIISQGICYSSTNSIPTINDSFVISKDTTSTFSCVLTNLNECTKYYCRAFAENKYGLVYAETNNVKDMETSCAPRQPAIVNGYVYDQDGFPLPDVKIKIEDYICATTNAEGYYEYQRQMNFNSESISLIAEKDNYNEQTNTISVKSGQTHQLDFILSLESYFSVDFATGKYIPMNNPWILLFECSQYSLAGKQISKTIRIKNNRNRNVDWSITNLPSEGISLSAENGSIDANSEVAITFTFTYPSMSSLNIPIQGCATGTKTYLWNWEVVAANYYFQYYFDIYTGMYRDFSFIPSPDNCSALCSCNPLISVSDKSESFSIIFNQFAIY